MGRTYAIIFSMLLVLPPFQVVAQEQVEIDREAVIQQARSLKNLYKTDEVFYKIRLMQCFYRLKGYAQASAIGKEICSIDTIPAILSLTGDSFNQLEQYDSALVWYNKA